MEDVRRLVDDRVVVRRQVDDRLAREAELDVVGVVPVAVLRVDPEVLLLPGEHAVAPDLALARAPHHRPVAARPDLAGLAPRCLLPELGRVIEPPRHRRQAGHDERGVVLLRDVEPVRVLVVHRHHVVLGMRLVEDGGPAPPAVQRDVGPAVVDLQHDLRVVRVDPDAVIVAVRRAEAGEGLAAVHRLVEPELVDVDLVLVLRVDADVVEVERARAQPLAVVDQRPGLAGVARLVEAALGAGRLDHRVEHPRIAARDVEVDLADQRRRQPGRELLPGNAAVGALVDAPLVRRPAADDVPALADAAVHRGVHHVGVLPVHFDVAAAVLGVHEQGLAPRPAAVAGLEDAALLGRAERRAERRRPHDLGVGRMDADPAHLPRFLEAGELEALAGVGGLEDAAADDDVRADGRAAGPDPDVIGIRRRDVDRPDRPGRDLAVADREPGDTGVLGLPHAAAGRAGVEGVWPLAHAGQAGDAAAARGADHPPLQVPIRLQRHDLIGIALRQHDGRRRTAHAGAHRDEGQGCGYAQRTGAAHGHGTTSDGKRAV